ncbi:MAG: hypothetical protein K2P94_09300 [Rhodospirillaceae bacterium]|nr:hypothetical protein [Rhodospirillaceae bacterium]
MVKSNFRRLIACAILAAGLAGCANTPADVRPDPVLQCRAERGMGGTGISLSDRGMGGTGLLAQDRGMGGTGIVGTVIGFGSICVNGFRIAYDAATPVNDGGTAVSADALERGLTVAVVAAAQNGQLHADTIEVLHALVGPVTTASDAAGVIAVMGVPVETSHAAGAAAESLAVGDVIAVDGLQRPNGVISATRIARMTRDARALVRGATSRTATATRIGAVAVVAAPENLPADGAWAAVTGTWAGGALTADDIKAGLELPSVPQGRISIEGYLVARPKGGYTVRGMALQENPVRGLNREMLGRLAAGQRVQVLGQRERDGSLRVETVIVPARPNPLSSDPTDSSAADQAEQPQRLRGVYGTTETRPRAAQDLAPVVRPNATRPIARPDIRPEIRPEIPRPPAPQRPSR